MHVWLHALVDYPTRVLAANVSNFLVIANIRITTCPVLSTSFSLKNTLVRWCDNHTRIYSRCAEFKFLLMDYRGMMESIAEWMAVTNTNGSLFLAPNGEQVRQKLFFVHT